MYRAIIVCMTLLVASCDSPHQLAKCKGPLIVMNADHWRPTATEVDALDKLCPEDR
jgi:hypothetical protein